MDERPLTWLGRRRAAITTVAPFAFLVWLPLVFWVWAIATLLHDNHLAIDFHHFFRPQAREVIDGHQPTTAYPPLTTLLYVPLALLPPQAGDIAATVIMMACAMGTLWILGVRDWRCYGAAAIWEPVYSAVQTANVALILTLTLAVLWRWRDRPLPAGALTAAMIALKLFLWPVAGWLWVTGRRRAVFLMLAIGLLASVAAWAVVGMSAARHFPDLVRGNVTDNGNKPYTVSALLRELGVGSALSYAVCWAVGAAVLIQGLLIARSGRERDGLTLVIAASLILSPIVWTPYLAVMLVPVALTSPRFSGLWLAPLPLWVVPPVDGSIASKGVLLVCAAATLTYAAGLWRPQRWGRRATITL